MLCLGLPPQQSFTVCMALFSFRQHSCHCSKCKKNHPQLSVGTFLVAYHFSYGHPRFPMLSLWVDSPVFPTVCSFSVLNEGTMEVCLVTHHISYCIWSLTCGGGSPYILYDHLDLKCLQGILSIHQSVSLCTEVLRWSLIFLQRYCRFCLDVDEWP